MSAKAVNLAVGEVMSMGWHGGLQKAVEGVQWAAHMALVRVQTRNDDEA
jgi:hypothetical protein